MAVGAKLRRIEWLRWNLCSKRILDFINTRYEVAALYPIEAKSAKSTVNECLRYFSWVFYTIYMLLCYRLGFFQRAT